MARACDSIVMQPQDDGWDMTTNARANNPHPSLAEGTYCIGLVDAAVSASGSPGGSLGTGMNVDIYTPGIEAV